MDCFILQGSVSTLFRWGQHIFTYVCNVSSCLQQCKNYKNWVCFSRLMTTNVLPRFFRFTVYVCDLMWALSRLPVTFCRVLWTSAYAITWNFLQIQFRLPKTLKSVHLTGLLRNKKWTSEGHSVENRLQHKSGMNKWTNERTADSFQFEYVQEEFFAIFVFTENPTNRTIRKLIAVIRGPTAAYIR